MLDKEQINCIYHKIWKGQHGKMTGVILGQYDVIVAAGVVSLGEAPPAATRPIAFSFNDTTLADGAFNLVLGNEITLGRISLVFREYEQNIHKQRMGSDVIMLKRL